MANRTNAKPKKQLKQMPDVEAATNTALVREKQLALRVNKLEKQLQAQKKPVQPKRVVKVSKSTDPHTPKNQKIHKCIVQYFSALSCPFDTPEGACVPYAFPVPSMRVKDTIRGTFNLGTTGQGYILMNAATVNDANAVAYTTNTSVGTAATNFSAYTNLGVAKHTKLPYATAALGSGVGRVLTRLVAQGLRIRYKGSEQNRNGAVYAFSDGQHADMSAQGGANVLTFPAVKEMRPLPEGQWHTVCWDGPSLPQETDFGNTAQFDNTNTYAGFYVDGTAGDQYEFQHVVHLEYAGEGIPGAERTHSDAVGFFKTVEVVKGATESAPFGSEPPKPLFDELCSAFDTTARNLIRAAPDVLSVIGGALLKTVPMLL